MTALDSAALDTLFRAARTRNAWVDEAPPESLWRELYEVVKFGPTSANCCPARFVFVTSTEGKARLGPLMSEGNQKALAAPCIVIIGHDIEFTEKMAELFPHNLEAKHWFGPSGSEKRIETAFRNGTLQGAYLMLAARAMGLDCGPMSGFDNAKVDAEFFADTSIKSNWLCALGHGADTPFPRSPRLSFDEAASFA
ncbi:malonic semialdehyde reductase [soil metagenome]